MTPPAIETWLERIAEDGFVVLPGVFASLQVTRILRGLEQAFAGQSAATAIRGESGGVYAARNVLDLWPETAEIWRQPPLPRVLADLLGPSFGLVRSLYFDKPPERTWALPWHKDLTVAVQDNRLPSCSFRKPTVKAGVPHVEAPLEVLERMATARIHLDDVTEENGPLKVAAGSHRTGKSLRLGDESPRSIQVQAGDVLLMRPLVAHASNRSRDGSQRHRRILHLEFAADPELPDGYQWHHFLAGGRLSY